MNSIGILALQGDFEAHQNILHSCGVESRQVRTKDQMEGLAGLILPGGESTTLLKLMQAFEFIPAIESFFKKGGCLFGTCAGSILLAKDIVNSTQYRFGFLDITIERNGYGRQVDSFETELKWEDSGESIHGIFIRAPRIVRIGPTVKVLASHNGQAVAVADDQILAATFHPEISQETRLHERFVEMVRKGK